MGVPNWSVPTLLNPGSHEPERIRQLAIELCATATAPQQSEFAKSLVATTAGCELLQPLLAQGALSLRALQGVPELFPQGLASEVRQELQIQIAAAGRLPQEAGDFVERTAGLDWSTASLELGGQMYRQHCAACHQFGKEGNLVGPQLDGVRQRGAARLCEDILAPNRNVDRAFRQTSLLLADDSVISGLVRDESDGSVTLVSQDGKSQSIPAAAVSQRRESTLSLMPSNFAELLNDQQLASLVKFLAESGLSP